jgi:hypothetical protein
MAQVGIKTRFDRYPALFSVAQARVAQRGVEQPRVLSFGCSNGDELLTIRKYFPTAHIFGCDIDLTAAAARTDLPGTIFPSTRDEIAKRGPFDVIFANSVLCHHAKQLPSAFPFAEYVELARMLHESLAPGGLLCIFNASYLFSELPFADDYRPVRSEHLIENGFVPKWHSSGARISRYKRLGKTGRQIVLRPELANVWDFRDCVFEKEPRIVTVRLSDVPTAKKERPAAHIPRLTALRAALKVLLD